MSEQICPQVFEFDQNFSADIRQEIAARIEHDVMVLADAAIRFAQIERVPRYTPETRENDAEHSFMVALIAQEIAARYFPEMDTGLIVQFCIVHDLVELKTGDTATFILTDDQLQTKATTEHSRLDEVCNELPLYTAMLLRTYEEQQVPEARFVRMLEKLPPVLVDLLRTGTQVMHEDYGVYTREQFDASQHALRVRYENMFPEPEFTVLHLARNGLVRRFSEVFEPKEELQYALFD